MSTTRALEGSKARGAKPNFFIVGAPKCGTTAWYEYLRSHPDIYFPDLKEPCFFALDLPGFRTVPSRAEYDRLYEAAGGAKIIGDASAVYLMSTDAAEAIRQHDPASKILILLRDQEQCLPSLHNQYLWEFAETIDDFETAWRLSGKREPASIPALCSEPRSLDYAAMGRFSQQVERYLERFPPGQLMVLWFDEWAAEPAAAYRRLLDFLEVDDDGRAEFPAVHQGMTYRSPRLARSLSHPPKGLKKAWRLVRRLTGLSDEKNVRLAQGAIRLLSSPGYAKQISRELRAEIRDYYAADNKLLKSRLAAWGLGARDKAMVGSAA